MTDRCLWTNRYEPGTRQIALEPPSRSARPRNVHVCPAHEANLRRFAEHANRYGGLFMALIGLSLFAGLMTFVLVGEDLAGGIMLACVGAVIAVFPFATPQTVALIGVRPSILIARALGLATFGVGVALVFAA